MTERCNEVPDCADSSDEFFCELIGFHGKSYRKLIAPKENNGKRTKVEINLNIEDIKNIDELNMKFSSRVTITIKWKDVRLFFKNLGGQDNLAEEEVNAIWKPPLILSNSLNLESVLKNEYLLVTIQQLIPGKPNNEKQLYEGTTHDGNENDLIMSAKVDTDFSCSYDLHSYPFDTQICTIDISSPDNLIKDIKLIPGAIVYSGKIESLPQFHFNIGEIKANENGTTISGFIHLKRIPFYHILCTYLPTVCIILMAIITLYIDESHFEATIMVALTAMLVLYTLFQSISENMPPTAYLKLLDIWLIFGLILPFIIFIIEVSWELMKQMDCDVVRSMDPLLKSGKTKCKIAVQIFIPIICGLFTIIYVIIVYIQYYQLN